MAAFKSCTMPVTGMTCSTCAGTIERNLRKLPGVSRADVNLAGETLTIRFDPALTDEKAIIARVQQIGYGIATAKVDLPIERLPEAKAAKAPIQKLTDEIGKYFIPIVIGIALLAFSSISIVTNSLRLRGYKVQTFAAPKSLPRQFIERIPRIMAPVGTLAALMALPMITMPAGRVIQGAMVGNMPPLTLMIMAVANGLTAISYFSIPLVLVVFVKKRKDIPFSNVFILFGAFILACGTTHLMHVIGLWLPVEGWQAAADTVTALISVTSAILLWPLLPRLLAIPSPEQLRVVNNELQKEKTALMDAQNELRKAYAEVEQRVIERTSDLAVELKEKQEAEKELAENYRLLAALINSPAGILIFSLDHGYCYNAFNENHRQEMRKIWGAEIETGMNMLELMTDADLRAAFRKSFDRALAGEAFTEINHQAGTEIYYEFTCGPIRTAAGEVTGLTAFTRDISEQKCAAEAIEESERRHRLSQKAAHIGSWEWEIPTDRLAWSDEMFIIFDKDLQEFVPTNQAVFDSILEEDKPAAAAAVETALTQGLPFQTEYRITDRSQIIKWVESRGEVIFNDQNQPLRALGTVQDITARKQAEEASRKSQILLNETQRITKVGGWEFDPATNKVTWTDEVYQIYGVSKEYDPGGVNQDVQFYAPEDQSKITEALRAAVEKGEPYSLELQLVTRQGTKLWVRTIGQAEQREGRIMRVFGNIMDITERKQADGQLTEQLDELRRWHAATLGREGRILELKHEVNQLLAQSGQSPLYPSAEAENQSEE